jgi:PiT family inorganic phosphate transporter
MRFWQLLICAVLTVILLAGSAQAAEPVRVWGSGVAGVGLPVMGDRSESLGSQARDELCGRANAAVHVPQILSWSEGGTIMAAGGAEGKKYPIALIVIILVAALAFDFLNGFHDAANSIATIVSTRVLSPTKAVVWAAFFNFIAAFLFGTGVAKVISDGYVMKDIVDPYVVFGGLLGAILWNIITWLMGLPTSSSHGLIAGIAGAAVVKGGFQVLSFTSWTKGWAPTIAFLFLSPLIGFVLGTLNMVAVHWICRFSSPSRVDHTFRRLQLVSAGIYSLGHGGNDAQKTMGIIVMLLSAAGFEQYTTDASNSAWNVLNFPDRIWGMFNVKLEHNIAWWIILACHAAIALGTMFGGWRIVKTMGASITRLKPVGGFCAETAAATTIIGSTFLHIPISTTHAITGSILGVGSVRTFRAVRWIWGQRIVVAWILTIPCSAFMAAVAYLVVNYLFNR